MNFENDTAENRLKKTKFLVEANSFEQHCLWKEYVHTATTPLKWEQMNGWLVTVNERKGRPICICLSWNRVNGHLVCFWNATSQLVDYKLIDKWLKENYDQKWDEGRRPATCDAQNFHHCIQALKQLDGEE